MNKQHLFRNFAQNLDNTVILELMLFGDRLVQARKKRKVSQEELAKQLGVHAPIIGRYERNEVKPSIEVAVKIAEALSISLDYLSGLTELELDTDIMRLFNELQTLKAEDQQHILKTLGALVREAKTRSTFG